MALNFQKIYTSNQTDILNNGIDSIGLSTSQLTPNNSENINFSFFPMAIATWVQCNYPARIRIYPTSESRDIDQNRNILANPPPDSTILLDAIFENENQLALPIQVGKLWVNQDSPQTSNFYARVTNLSNNPRIIYITLKLSIIGYTQRDLSLNDIFLYG